MLFTNPILDGGPTADLGDPFVLEYAGRYVLYHSGPHGIDAWESVDLVDWRRVGRVLGPEPGHWGEIEFWAPEVVHERGQFVMYVAAAARGGGVRDSGRAHGADGGDESSRRQGVAIADHPYGPFRWLPDPIVPEWAIDAHPFTDADGTRWLFYNIQSGPVGDTGLPGTGTVVAPLLDATELGGAASEVTLPSAAWEGNHERFWNEGPFVLRRGENYWQMYSGGFFGDEGYGVGLAHATHPKGPWTKVGDAPVFSSGDGISGPGHHCVVLGPDGATPWAIYHGYVGQGFGRKVHLDRLHWTPVGPRIAAGRPTHGEQSSPPGAAVDPAVHSFHVRTWVHGRRARLAGVEIELTGGVHVLTARCRMTSDGEVVDVTCDGRLVATTARAHRDLGVEGVVLHHVVTSRLEDERVHRLAHSQRSIWAWGGRGRVEAEVAVRGSGRLALGSTALEVDCPEWTVVHLSSDEGAHSLQARAVGQLEVAEVAIAAR